MNGQAKYILEIENPEDLDNAQASDCDILGINFGNLDSIQVIKNLLPKITKPLMVRTETAEIIEVLDRPCIIAFAQESNYQDVVPPVIEGGHTLVIRTPIDINIAKEMNILASEMGLPLDKIIIDTDIGGLGYGLEYGYSMMEKIKLEKADKYLNMPLISFVVEESLKTKEAKTQELMYETASASAALAAGADYIVLKTPQAVKVMKGLV